MLSKINSHKNDSRVRMNEENHQYFIDNLSKNTVSCTAFLSSFFKKFIVDEAIANILNSEKYLSDPDYKYYKKTEKDIQKEWSDANKDGTALHLDIENFLNNIEINNNSKEYGFFKSFLKDHDSFTPYRTEWIIFSDAFKICGSIDAVFKDSEGNFVLFDWKRSVVTYENFDNAKFPIDHLNDNKFVKYSIQLNLYRHILETCYDIKIKDMFIIELYPDNDSYKKIHVERMEEEIKNLFACRAEALKKSGYTLPELNQYKLTRKNNNTQMARKRWTTEQEENMLSSIKQGKTTSEIAIDHCRTENAIRLRILLNAAILLEKNQHTMEEICELYRIKEEDLETYISKNKTDPKSKMTDVIEKLKYVPSSPSSTSSAEIIEEIKPKKRKIILSEKQNLCIKMMKEGENIFLTGQAGTGKSLVISSFINEFHTNKNIAVTATTGSAAILLNGTTLFSYLGIGLGTASADLLIIQLKKKKFFLDRWTKLDVLIIDEISMLSPELFDKLELVARSLRRNDKPFGGIQLILTGDFFQLPNINQKDMFCFDAESWDTCIGNNVINLNINFRQRGDDVYQKCLNEVRYGAMSDDTIKLLKQRENFTLSNEFGITPTKIYSLNANVDEENTTQLDRIFEKDNDTVFFDYPLNHEVFKKNLKLVEEKIKKSCNAPFNLQLCKGAQVMLLYNMDIDNKLVNGSRGIVVGFEGEDEDKYPRVRFLSGTVRVIRRKTWEIEENGEIVIAVDQVPLKLAYATTVHRSQGATIDYAEVDMEGIFEFGQAYVALSRVKSLDGLSIKNFSHSVIKAHPKVIEFYNKY